jgi:phage portal protein BeeE
VRLVDRLLRRWDGYNENLYSGAVLVMSDDPSGRGKEPPAAGFAARARQVYAGNGPVFAALFARMSLLSQAEFKFQNKADQRLYGNTSLALLEQPWPNGTSSDLLARMEQDRSLAGNAYLRKAADDLLIRMRPDTVTIISEERKDDLGRLYKIPVGYSEDLGPLGYQGREPQYYEASEVAHWGPDPDPSASWRGMSWLTPVIREITGDTGLTQYKIEHIRNGAMPGIVLKYSQKLSETAVASLKKRFAALFSGPENSGRTLVLDEGADVTVAGSTLADLQFTAVQGAGVERILAASAVPAEICGLTAGGTTSASAGYETAMRRMADMWARPSWRSACSALEPLMPHAAGNAGVRLWFDVGGIAALREGELSRAQGTLVRSQALAAFVNAGFTRESAIAAAESGDLSQLKPDPNAMPPGVMGRETTTARENITPNGQLAPQQGPGVIAGRPPQAGLPQRLPGVGHPNLPNALPAGAVTMPALPNGARGPQAKRDTGEGDNPFGWLYQEEG